MFFLFLHPVAVFVVSFLVLWLAAVVGVHLKKATGFDQEKRSDFGLIQAATLTLLGLLIGFSFSMAVGRYDQRKNFEEAEANAIGTEYLRADLLATPDRDRIRGLLKKYTELRIRYYLAELDGVESIDARTAQLQGELWSAVVGPAGQKPDPVVALVVSGMNDVINAQGYTLAAWRYHVPLSAMGLMVLIAALCNVLVGYGSSSVASSRVLLMILPLFVATTFMLMYDIDSPRRGLIRVAPTNLESLLASLQAQ
jgi:hypothetical protein